MIYFSWIYWDFLHDLVCSVIEKESQALEKNVDSTAEWDGPVCSIYWHQIYSVIIVFLSLFTLLSERSAYHQRKWITIDLMDNSPFRSMDACFAYFSVLCWVWAFMTVIANWLLNHDEMPSLLTMLAWVYLLSPGSRSHRRSSPPLPLQLEVRPHEASFLHTKYGETARSLVWLVSVWPMFPSAILSFEWWGILPQLHVEYWWRRAHTAFMAHTASWACGSFVWILLCVKLLFVGFLD